MFSRRNFLQVIEQNGYDRLKSELLTQINILIDNAKSNGLPEKQITLTVLQSLADNITAHQKPPRQSHPEAEKDPFQLSR